MMHNGTVFAFSKGFFLGDHPFLYNRHFVKIPTSIQHSSNGTEGNPGPTHENRRRKRGVESSLSPELGK